MVSKHMRRALVEHVGVWGMGSEPSDVETRIGTELTQAGRGVTWTTTGKLRRGKGQREEEEGEE